jgi:TolA-binding protein
VSAGSPASQPVADLTARVDSLENQLRTLTGQVETDGNRIKKLDEAIKAMRADYDARLKLLEPSTTPVKVDPARKTAITAVEIPSTGDAVEDAYTYAFRLWTAKLYPEAQVKLKEFVAKYPTHKKFSYAQNLLGRAYLDEGKPALASVAFYDNYQKMPRGERANESLYWLGISLTKLKKPADACKVYKEFDDVYAAKAPSDLKSRVTKGKADAKCTA